VALALRATDPALLHYRSGAFYCMRAALVGGIDPVDDILAGMFAAAREPIAGGRHKVFGRWELSIVPTTSTVASHLPRAVGMAYAVDQAPRHGVSCPWPESAIVVCSLGDASVNHSTAAGALNAAAALHHRRQRLPLLVVCEDNGWGISTPTPPGWVAAVLGRFPGLRYEAVDGTRPAEVHDRTAELATWVREEQTPALLHLRTVRFLGHAGSDVETAYRSPGDIRADHARDPLLGTAQMLVAAGVATPAELIDTYTAIGERVAAAARAMVGVEPLRTREQVMAPLAPRRPGAVAALTPRPGAWRARQTLAQALNGALADILETFPEAFVLGEDVGAKGGVYGVTKGLQATFGPSRVVDTLLDEQTILGLALGTAVSGFLPIPEIQYLAFLHNAEDQLRGEAATLSFFSSGRYRNGMVVRVASYGYQEGFGGHFHNDNAVGVLRDVPGLVIASPSLPGDAAAMLRTCAAAARADGTVSVLLEPIARYHTRDLFEQGDGGWLQDDTDGHIPIGRGAVYGDGTDLLLVSWANGLYLSFRAARRLAAAGVSTRVLDLRWLAPLPVEQLLEQVDAVRAVLVVDETRRTGGVSEAILAALVDAGRGGRIGRVCSADSFVPLGDAARLVLVSEDDIVAAAGALLGASAHSPR
jgi:2-oxoisovalerate dehydrogenase E1 component